MQIMKPIHASNKSQYDDKKKTRQESAGYDTHHDSKNGDR